MDTIVAVYLARIVIRNPAGEPRPDLAAARIARVIEDRVANEVHEYPHASVHVTAERTDR